MLAERSFDFQQMLIVRVDINMSMLTRILGGVLILSMALIASTASAAPLFTECPATGNNTGCEFLITINPGGGLSIAQDTTAPNNGPYDGIDDTLVGVVNNSGGPVSSFALSSTLTIYGFENDGPCTETPGPTGCGASPNNYGGPGVTFSGINAAKTSGTINFGPALANGGTAWFGLEEALSITSLTGSITVTKAVVGGPAPAGNFSITVACPAATGIAAYSATLNVTVTTPGVFTGVPIPNTACTVTEGATLPTPPTNYIWNVANTPPAPLTAVSVGNSVTVTNTLVRQTSSITLSKTVTGAPAGGAPGTYNFSANCGADGTYTGSVVLGSGVTTNSGPLAGVPVGAVCSVSETGVPTAPTNYTWNATPPAVPLTITLAGPNGASFTNTLTRLTGSLTVAKTVTGGPAGGGPGTYSFNADCSASGDGATHAVSVTVASTTGNSTITLPAGAVCTVAEGTLPTPPTGYSYGTAMYTGNPATIPAGSAATVGVTNPLNPLATGSIVVTKTIVGGPNPSGSFSISVNCPATPTVAGYSMTQTVAAGASTTFSGIPTPQTCSVTENTPLTAAPTNYTYDGSNTPPPAQAGITVAPGSSNSITVTNHLLRQSSTITVSKTVTGGPSGGVTGTFNFTADCTASSDGTYTGSIALSGATSGSGSITSVPAGANCTVSEGALPTSPQYYTWGTTPPAVTFVTTNAGPNTASFTNTLTRDPSTITLNKTVTGGPAAGVTGDFTFSADCTASGDGTFSGTVTLTGATSGSSTITSVPAGANCTVSETAMPTAPTGYSWGAVPSAVTFTTTEAGPNAADFTNTLTRQPSTITVNKTVAGGPAGGVSGTFMFDVDCTASSDGTFSGTIILTAATSGSVGVGVPANATCTVSETSVPAAPSNYAWDTTPPAVTLTTTMAGPNTANFTNTLNSTFVPIAITVPALRGWELLLLGAMLLLMGVYVQQRRSKD